ncbi:MAG: GxxExxY protein [Candidatus Brocadiia bacterium]
MTDANEHELILRDEVYRIVGAALEVSNQLGCGFLEAVYQEAMEIELAERAIPFESQKRIMISYKGRQLAKEYSADLVCFGQIIVEIKALAAITGTEGSQMLNYLKGTKLPVGLLVNFGVPQLEWKRYALTMKTRYGPPTKL